MRPVLLLALPLLTGAAVIAPPAAAAPVAAASPSSVGPPQAPGRSSSCCLDPVQLTVGAHSASTPLVCIPWT